jgi:hypothetical protein
MPIAGDYAWQTHVQRELFELGLGTAGDHVGQLANGVANVGVDGFRLPGKAVRHRPSAGQTGEVYCRVGDSCGLLERTEQGSHPDSSLEAHIMWFELNLIQKGLVTVEQMLAAVKRQQTGRIPLGRLAIEHGEMTMAQVFEVLEEQADNPKSFGQLAIAMNFLDEDELGHLLLIQSMQEQPLGDILVEMGCLSREQLEFESSSLRRTLTSRFETCDVEATCC